MARKSKVIKTPGWWILLAVIRDSNNARSYSEEIRRLSFMDRRWCRGIGAWAVSVKHTQFVQDIAKQYLDIKVK